MKTKEWFNEKQQELEQDSEYKFMFYQTLIVEKILERMEEKDITKIKLAALLNVSPPYITKMLNGSNFTLKTLIEICDKLDLDFIPVLKKRSNKKTQILPLSNGSSSVNGKKVIRKQAHKKATA